jgi:uncharacterized protein YlxW (UPF0749 family)
MTHTSALQNAVLVVSAAGGISGISAYLTYRIKRREVAEAATLNTAAAAKTLTDTAVALLEPLRTAAAEAERKVAAIQERVRDLEHAVETLSASLAAATAASDADRAELTRQLEQVTAERDKLLAERSSLPGANAVQGV